MSVVRGSGSADTAAGWVGGGGEGVPWPTGADGYKLDKIIGKGAFATVWKAFCATRGVHVAVKVMDLENVTHSFEDIRQEVCGLVTHSCEVFLYFVFVKDNALQASIEVKIALEKLVTRCPSRIGFVWFLFGFCVKTLFSRLRSALALTTICETARKP